MANAGFYNVNEYRQYPFIDNPAILEARRAAGLFTLPEQLIVDCGFILGLDSEFNAVSDFVYLSRLAVTANDYVFTFRATAGPTNTRPLVFTRAKLAGKYESWQYEYKQSTADTNKQCATEPVWEGFIVTGNLQEANVPAGVYDFEPGQYVVEPATLQSLVRSYLRSISVGNYARTIIPNCVTNDSSASAVTQDRQVIEQSNCLKGDVQFVAGINCLISQSDISRRISISPLLGANLNTTTAAELCANYGELPLFPGESPPAGSQFLSGGPACNELITSINGITGPNVIINGGPGIIITTDPAANKIVLNISDTLISREC